MLYQEFLNRTYFTKEELVASGMGTIVEDPPEGGVASLPAPPFLMFDRITTVEKTPRGGTIIAEQDIHLDAWYFMCHFRNDPVQPGCLGVDAIWQLVGFFCALNGAIGSGRALGCRGVDFSGQIRPHDKIVRYEAEIKKVLRLKDSGAFMAIANGAVFVDGTKIYTIEDAKVGVFRDIAYDSYPSPASPHARGGIIRAQNSSEGR
jgi:3-hydroxyacyl-[acyl-carrier protein] dehydratase/trans-2-decenoyl-[acyl-carrier protein] isomerase